MSLIVKGMIESINEINDWKIAREYLHNQLGLLSILGPFRQSTLRRLPMRIFRTVHFCLSLSEQAFIHL